MTKKHFVKFGPFHNHLKQKHFRETALLRVKLWRTDFKKRQLYRRMSGSDAVPGVTLLSTVLKIGWRQTKRYLMAWVVWPDGMTPTFQKKKKKRTIFFSNKIKQKQKQKRNLKSQCHTEQNLGVRWCKRKKEQKRSNGFHQIGTNKQHLNP